MGNPSGGLDIFTTLLTTAPVILKSRRALHTKYVPDRVKHNGLFEHVHKMQTACNTHVSQSKRYSRSESSLTVTKKSHSDVRTDTKAIRLSAAAECLHPSNGHDDDVRNDWCKIAS